LTTVKVNRKAADRAASGHPWIFSSDVTDRGDAAPGDVVRVADPRGRFIGVAHYSSLSQITLRLLSAQPDPPHSEPLDRPFFLRRLTAAIAHRERVVEGSNACPMVF
jgi:23S rRNA (cytosine1962-C5)-methyltransferase